MTTDAALVVSGTPGELAKLEGVSSPQMEAAILLASGKSYKETAREVGVSPVTIWTWMKGETRSLVNRLRTQMAEAVVNKLAASAAEIADILLDISRGKTTAKVKQVDAILATLSYTIGRGKGEGRGLTLHAGAGSFEGAHITVGYPTDQCPAEMDQGDG